MIVTHDEARALLHRDRHWCIYALGDLDPRRQAHCQWFRQADDSVALLYREFDTPILFASGGADALIEALAHTESCYCQVPLDLMDEVEARFKVEHKRPMHRLRLDPADLRPVPHDHVEVLSVADEAEVRKLYANGEATHETPDFFFASQMDDATFHGVRLADGSLAAAGGTHLFSQQESVGAIGNIYTHRDHRGRGHASAITSAIAQSLVDRGIETIALNVKGGNDGALRIYERLGFRLYCDYWEGVAVERIP